MNSKDNYIPNGEISLVNGALYCASRGWPVLPMHNPSHGGCSCKDPNCNSIGKHPQGGLSWKKATTDRQKILKWWRIWSDANIGIRTGSESGLVVIDADIYKDNGKSLSDLVREYGPIPKTLTATSGAGGKHFYFQYPNTSIPTSVGEIAEFIDVKADGGMIIAPPSRHQSSGYYEWENPEVQIAPLPKRLFELIIQENKKVKSDIPKIIPKGHRNTILTSIAGYMHRKGIPHEVIKAALNVLNHGYCQPPLEDHEVIGIIESITQRYASAESIFTLKDRIIVRDAEYALTPQPPINWVIEDLFAEGSVNLVFGVPGSKKTYLLLSAGVHIAIGDPWLGKATKKNNVLFIDEESGERRLCIRLSKVLNGRSAGIKTPLSFVSLARFNLLKPEDALTLKELICDCKAGFVVIDALADVMEGGDENSVKDIQPVFMRLRDIAEDTGTCIVIIHHSKKAGVFVGVVRFRQLQIICWRLKVKKIPIA